MTMGTGKPSRVKLLALLVMSFCCFWIGCAPMAHAQSVGSPLAQISTYMGPDRTAKLMAGAKAEGVVNVYTSETVEDIAALSAAFQSKYRIKLNVWRGSSEDILQRGVVEARGGRFDADAFETGATAMESLHRERLLQPTDSPAFADLAPQAITSHHEWIGTRYNIFAAAYNTRAVDKSDLPQAYDDLVAPKWKGKLGIEADDSDWFGAVVDALGEAKGLKLFRDIVSANGISVRKGHTLLANLVISGEVPLALSTYVYRVAQMKHRGAPIDWVAIAPVIARFEGVGVARRAPHPYGAMLYMDFMLTDAQDILAKRDFYPADIKVKPMPADMKLTFLDPAKALDQSEKWSKYYKDIVTHPVH
ncbi:MAG TPA: extracellular solute-binding protein [Xanthobacteraceae bacterium]|nr:extracellular solute-binding protein [Xanthobacteraceae bacterium]